jgi:serine/threonine-protein kinase
MTITGAGACATCAHEVQEGWRVCPSCGTPLEGATRTAFGQAPPSSSGVEEGRFPAGTVLAGRYKILGLIGRGGMGEVYRAFDQILNQGVALKFISGHELDEGALNRFRNEVRVARQVSHPNVCRVYDIGFVEGMHFLSMEYLDGENVGSLLRRIGRLPQDKAVEFARKICAGLAAAHERGVLHRDLKPANIMIDGRGQVRITDFGLAAFAKEISIGDLRSGTPAYMSPEQKARHEVTTRSDIYALGLVLYEMFTGKRRSDSNLDPSNLVKDLDPGIEQIVLRCLDDDPRRRPATPLAVAMALPGGDPVAAALAAGETPSPEMVAASEVKEGFTPRVAVLCFVIAVLATVIGAFIAKRSDLLNHLPIPIPADGLAFRAEDVLERLGYADLPPFTAYGFQCCDQEAKASAERLDAARRDEVLASHRPAVVTFWYRRSPIAMLTLPSPDVPVLIAGAVTASIPPQTEPGSLLLRLDPRGRLMFFQARPLTRAKGNASTPEWNPAFDAAGLDLARFTPAVPERVPAMAVDSHQAWTGSYGGDRTEVVRVEAASFQGRPVFFEVGGATAPVQTAAPQARFIPIAFLSLIIGCLVATGLVAWRNTRLGRTDQRGAGRLATFVFALIMLQWAVGATHVAGAGEITILVGALMQAAFWSGLMWLFYVAIEPYVRRNWPESLISWGRLHAGQLRDPLVASHVLAGLAAGLVFERIVLLGAWAFLSPTFSSFGDVGLQLAGTPANLAVLFFGIRVGLFIGMFLLIFVVLIRLVSRRLWVANVAGALAFSPLGLGIIGPVAGPIIMLVGCLSWLWMLQRLGLLPVLVVFTVFVTRFMPMVLDGWLATRSIALHSIPLVIAALALWAVLAAQPRLSTASNPAPVS